MLLAYGYGKVSPGWHVTETEPPGYSRVYYVYGGAVTYTDADKSFMLRPGCLYWFPSNKPYRMTEDEEERIDCLHFHIDVSPNAVTAAAEIEVKNDAFLLPYLKAAKTAVMKEEEEILEYMSEILALDAHGRGIIRPLDSAVSAALSYISENPYKKISIDELSGMSGYTKQHFIRLFKHSVGLTPHRYITELRMKHALSLLKQDMPIKQAAEMLGYADGKAFDKAFVNRYGMTPTHWKNRREYTP